MASAVAVATPRTLSNLTVTSLARIGWDKGVREDIVRGSPFRRIPTSYSITKRKELNMDKLGMFLSIPAGAGGPVNEVRMALRMPYNGPPQIGPASVLIGNEEDAALRYANFYYQEHRKAFKQSEYGYSANELKYLDLNSGNPQAGKRWWAEYDDLRIHQTLLNRFEDALINAPTSLSQTLNPHFLIGNSNTPRVLWDKDAPTRTAGSADDQGWYSAQSYSGGTSYVEAVVDALMTANGTGSTPKILPNIDFWAMIAWYAENEMMFEKVEIDGIMTIPLFCPPHVIAWAMNPKNTGSIASYVRKPDVYQTKDRECLPGEVGRIFDKLLLIADERYTTINVSGSDGSWVVTPGFQYPGGDVGDHRNKDEWSNTSGSENYSFDNIIAVGANAIGEYLVDPLNSNLSEFYDYKKIKGMGSYLGSGMQLVSWDVDSASRTDGANTTLIHRSSFVVPVGRVRPYAVT
jgi:hypothetical protein